MAAPADRVVSRIRDDDDFSGSLSSAGVLAYDPLTDLFSVQPGGGGPASTDDLAEGIVNLYYTTARARGAVSASAPLSYNSGTGLFSWGGTTSDVPEGSRLYYTDPRAQAGVGWVRAAATVQLQTATDQVGIGGAPDFGRLGVFGLSGQWTAHVKNAGAAGSSYGLRIDAGGNASDFALFCFDRAAANGLLAVQGDGTVMVNRTSVGGAQDTFVAYAVAGRRAGHFIGGNAGGLYTVYVQNAAGGAGLCNGLRVDGGTNSSDFALLVENFDGSSQFLGIRGDGRFGLFTVAPAAWWHAILPSDLAGWRMDLASGQAANAAEVRTSLGALLWRVTAAGYTEAARALIGSWSADTTYAIFANKNQNSTGGYAIIQDDAGDTYLNCQSGATLNFRVANISQAILSGTGLAFGCRTSQTVIALTDAATTTVDASAGNTFAWTIGGNRTLAKPTGGVDGQLIRIRIRQDGTGSRVLTLAAGWRLGADITSVVLSTAAGKTDYLGAMYSSTDDVWDVISFTRTY